jgi:hypothetical protein
MPNMTDLELTETLARIRNVMDESDKDRAEAWKFRREPWIAAVAASAALATVFTAIIFHFIH